MVASKWEVELTDEELLYLIVHIERLVNHDRITVAQFTRYGTLLLC